MENKILKDFIVRSLEEDLGDGDHSSLACIPAENKGKARLLVKEDCILAGARVAGEVFHTVDPELRFDLHISDGTPVTSGDVVFIVSGRQQSILKAERLVLNIMQRMSGIATQTKKYTDLIKDLHTRITDTRKTTPGMRFLEKEAVRIGGGYNHRMGLYDMIMLKDNHIDYAGGIEKAISKTRDYLASHGLDLKVVIEARSISDVERIISFGGVDRIMLDNFDIRTTAQAVSIIGGRFETESSGGITFSSIRSYAECGVDFISVGALTHQIKSVDLSLKAI